MSNPIIRQYLIDNLTDRLKEPRRFIQVLAGPRQVGKTPLVEQCLEKLDMPSHYASDDAPALEGPESIPKQWEYWREGNNEIDFVLKKGKIVVGIEVKSGRSRRKTRGLEIFRTHFSPMKNLLIGEDGIDIERFLLTPIKKWLEN